MDFFRPIESVPDYLHIEAADQPTGETRIVLRGELDVQTVPLVSAAVAQALTPPLPRLLSLDGSELTFLDAAGVRTLLGIHQMAGKLGVRFVLTDPTPLVVRVLNAVGVAATFGVAQDRPSVPRSRLPTAEEGLLFIQSAQVRAQSRQVRERAREAVERGRAIRGVA